MQKPVQKGPVRQELGRTLSLALIGVVFALTLGLGGPTGDGPSPAVPASESIQVVSSSHQINFPREVVFTLQAESSAAITEVTLFYKLGGREVRVYGYADFTPGRQVTATFTIPTDGADYVPSGVDIEYYYVILDAEGNTSQSEVFSLEYKDPAYKWQRLEQGDLIILWHNRPIEAVTEVASIVNGRLESAKRVLGLDGVRPMKAVILNGRSEASRSFPVISNAATVGHFYGGFAFGDLDVFVLAGLNANGVTHEMTHLLLDEAVDSPLARVPAWLNEGLAMYFEQGSRSRQVLVSRAAADDALISLRHMGNVPGRARDISLFYAQSWSIVDSLIDTHGEDRMAALLRAINDGKGIENAVIEAYGMGLDELESDWRTSVGGRPLSPASIAGSLGTSAIIVGAVAVAIVVMLLRFLRHSQTQSSSGN